MRCPRSVFTLAIFSALVCCGLSHAADTAKSESDDKNFDYQTVTTKEGLNFRVPEDMPIQKKDGIVAPVPFDEYMYGKFKKMDARLDHIEQQLTSIEKTLQEMKQSQPKVLKAGGNS
jgi:hypothetical protein